VFSFPKTLKATLLVVMLLPAIGGAPRIAIREKPGFGNEGVLEITVFGTDGTEALLQRATALAGPWQDWTNVPATTTGTVAVEQSSIDSPHFYRVKASEGPAGFVWIHPGKFLMGSPSVEWGRRHDEIQHEVVLTKGYWMSDHEVTQSEYESVMGANPSTFKGIDLPVEKVKWSDANSYCLRLTERERAAGRISEDYSYRLPTESEWEYACRAGNDGPFSGDLDATVWYLQNSNGKYHPVKTKQANAWGLFDMHGNVREWCSDWLAEYPTETATNPQGPTTGALRVFRGGSWTVDYWSCRSASRFGGGHLGNGYQVGIRLVFSAIR